MGCFHCVNTARALEFPHHKIFPVSKAPFAYQLRGWWSCKGGRRNVASWPQKKGNIMIKGVGLILALRRYQRPILTASLACMKGANGEGRGSWGMQWQFCWSRLPNFSPQFIKIQQKQKILNNIVPKIKHRATEILFKYLLIKFFMFWPNIFWKVIAEYSSSRDEHSSRQCRSWPLKPNLPH